MELARGPWRVEVGLARGRVRVRVRVRFRGRIRVRFRVRGTVRGTGRGTGRGMARVVRLACHPALVLGAPARVDERGVRVAVPCVGLTCACGGRRGSPRRPRGSRRPTSRYDGLPLHLALTLTANPHPGSSTQSRAATRQTTRRSPRGPGRSGRSSSRLPLPGENGTARSLPWRPLRRARLRGGLRC